MAIRERLVKAAATIINEIQAERTPEIKTDEDGYEYIEFGVKLPRKIVNMHPSEHTMLTGEGMIPWRVEENKECWILIDHKPYRAKVVVAEYPCWRFLTEVAVGDALSEEIDKKLKLFGMEYKRPRAPRVALPG